MDLDKTGTIYHHIPQELHTSLYHIPISPMLPRPPNPHQAQADLTCYSVINAQDTKINSALARDYEYLPKAIHYLSTNIKYAHMILAIIKTSIQEEADI